MMHKIPVTFFFDIFHLSLSPTGNGSTIENAESIPNVNNAMKNIRPKKAGAKGSKDIAVG